MKKIAKFFANVKKEMQMVRWPHKKEMISYSIETISFIALFMVFFAAVDVILSFVVRMVG